MNEQSKGILGVIGGLGPLATAYFMEMVTGMTDADCDQQHLDMIVYNFPSIPDRTAHILDNSKPSPAVPMLHLGQRLAQQGVCQIAIPCMTAHYYREELAKQVNAPILDGVEATAEHLHKQGITRVGIMATDGCVASGMFQRTLEKMGMQPILPDETQQKNVMHLVYQNIKANLPPEMDRFRAVSDQLRQQGAQAIILGCTELSLIKRDYAIGAGYIDAMEALARQAVICCGAKLKTEFENILTR